MKRLSIVLLFTVIIWTAFLAPALADCSQVIIKGKAQGFLEVTMIKDDIAYTDVEPLLWKRLPYKQKAGIAKCVANWYGVKRVMFYEVGTSNLLDDFSRK